METLSDGPQIHYSHEPTQSQVPIGSKNGHLRPSKMIVQAILGFDFDIEYKSGSTN